jgi:hypothetical protein
MEKAEKGVKQGILVILKQGQAAIYFFQQLEPV